MSALSMNLLDGHYCHRGPGKAIREAHFVFSVQNEIYPDRARFGVSIPFVARKWRRSAIPALRTPSVKDHST
jgi:hypothetical protein